MPHQQQPTTARITEGHAYLLAAVVALTATGVLWATGYEHNIATALLVAVVAVGVRGWRSLASDEARRREWLALRGELIHYAEVIRLMAEGMEAADVRHERAIERAHQAGAAEASAEAAASRQRLVEQHLEELEEVGRKAEARGYVAGARQRLAKNGLCLKLVRPS